MAEPSQQPTQQPRDSDPAECVGNVDTFAGQGAEKVERWLARLLSGQAQTGAGMVETIWNQVKSRVADLIAAVKDKKAGFVLRDEAIEVCVASLISGVPALLLGPPGTAKSAIVRRIAALCGLTAGESSDPSAGANGKPPDGTGRYFEYLLTNHTMPEEVFGGLDLEQLATGRVVRVTAGKLPRAEIAFLDEVFRGGSHILNTLLTIINERRYDSGNGSEHVPLLSILGASNNPPVEEDLEAFFDRFPIRIWLDSVFDTPPDGDDPAEKLLEQSLTAERRRIGEVWDPQGERGRMRKFCTNDLRVARAYLIWQAADHFPASRRRQFLELFRGLRQTARFSDRSLGQFWLFAAALDLVRGGDPRGDWEHRGKGHGEVFWYTGRTREQQRRLRDQVARHMWQVGPMGSH